MSKYDSRPGFVIEKIGELIFKPTTTGGADFGAVVAQDFDVKVEYAYSPGHPGNLQGAFEDAVEPMQAELEIRAIRADAHVHFDGEGVAFTAYRGVDLIALFSRQQVAALEVKLLAGLEQGGAQ